jgi:hypothetical protein
MPKDTSAIRTYFAKLGLEPEIADLYLTLHAYGQQTISSLSRNSGIERTRVYRLLDGLTAHNLIESETHYKRTILRAAPILNLQILLTQREQELRTLQTELEHLHRTLNKENVIESPLTRVQFYHGNEGVKQMFWNQTKGSGEQLSILYETMQTRSGMAFFERWVRLCNEREDMTFRGLISDHFLEEIQNWYGKHVNERLVRWESRYISPDIFPITHSTVTYDNVIAYYNWKDGDLFGIEVYNQEIADTHRRIFEMLWVQANAVTDDLGWKIGQQTSQKQTDTTKN